MVKFIKIIFFLFIPLIALSQNLVYNPNFETISDTTPKRIKCLNWYSVNGSPDYYNLNFDFYKPWGDSWIFPKGKSGISYMGIALIDNTGFIEQLGGELKEKMVKGQEYKIEFYMRNSDKTLFSTWNIGIYFSNNKLSWHKKINDEYYTKYSNFDHNNYANTLYINKTIADIQNPTGKWISNTKKWTKFEGVYIAKGGEKYLTIGGFYIDDKRFNKEIKKAVKKDNDKLILFDYIQKNLLKASLQTDKRNHAGSSYIFIDDVSVYPIDEKGEPIILYPELLENKKKIDNDFENTFNENETGKALILKDINFKLNDSTLLPESFNTLNNLVNYMQANPNIKIEIGGHTDNTGTSAYNQTLSTARARAVYIYLANNEIKKNRLKYIGYGNSLPIGDNNTEKGKEINRRVEIKVFK